MSALTDRMDVAGQTFASHWRAWITQLTQPQWLRLSESYLGGRHFHSSQMSGIGARRTTAPAPLFFLAVGLLNTAHARSLGWPPDRVEAGPDMGLPLCLPEALRDVWITALPFTDGDGIAMGPAGLFAAFTGLQPLPVSIGRPEALEGHPDAIPALARHLRLALAQKGVDWVSEMPSLREQVPIVEPLLYGHDVQTDQLLLALPDLALLVGQSAEQLWGVMVPAQPAG